MSYRDYPASSLLLIGYDPERDLSKDHLVRFIDEVVETSVSVAVDVPAVGRPAYHPKLCLKVLLYGYATGIRSSRQLEKHCKESLPFLFLTRGDAPCYHTLCTARTTLQNELSECWVNLFGIAKEFGIRRIGRIDIDSSKFRANVSPESVIKRCDYEEFRDMLK
jgi:transposase